VTVEEIVLTSKLKFNSAIAGAEKIWYKTNYKVRTKKLHLAELMDDRRNDNKLRECLRKAGTIVLNR